MKTVMKTDLMTAMMTVFKTRAFWKKALLVTLLGVGLMSAWLLIRNSLEAPLLYASWTLQIVYQLMPQGFLWIALLIIAIIAALASLLPPARLRRGRIYREPQGAERRVQILADYVRNGRRSFYRNRLNVVVSRLAIGVLSLRMRVEERDVRNAILDETLDMPPERQAYLATGLQRWADLPGRNRWFGWLFPNDEESVSSKRAFQDTLNFLEEELEITHDDRNS